MRRRGLTLLEVIIVLALTSALALVVGATIQASGQVHRDVYVSTDVAELGARLAEELESRLVIAANDPVPNSIASTGNAPTPRAGGYPADTPPGVGPDPGAAWLERPSLTFVQRWADPVGPGLLQGAWLSAREQVLDGMLRFRWEPSPQPRRYAPGLAPGEVSEAVLQIDLDGDGVVSSDAGRRFLVGHLVMEVLDASGAVTRSFPLGARGPARVLWNAPAPRAPAAPLRPIFSRVDDPATPGDEAALTADLRFPGVQLNLTVLHDPVPSGGGRTDVTVLRIQRVVAPR